MFWIVLIPLSLFVFASMIALMCQLDETLKPRTLANIKMVANKLVKFHAVKEIATEEKDKKHL